MVLLFVRTRGAADGDGDGDGGGSRGVQVAGGGGSIRGSILDNGDGEREQGA